MMTTDSFTETDVIRCLDNANLKYRVYQNYIHCQCPTHEDKAPSCQIFKNDWFVGCLAGCPRVHITKIFPELRDKDYQPTTPRPSHKPVIERTYQNYEMLPIWEKLPMIPRDHNFKNLPLEHLDELGWRYTTNETNMGAGYFIPYFGKDKTTIPFAQVRHLSGNTRFNFLKDAEPIVYGMWNLSEYIEGNSIMIVEGTSDFAVLDYCFQPVIAIPSASFGAMMVKLCKWLHKRSITVLYAGDNDTAGDKLYNSIQYLIPHEVLKPPAPYKDWGDFFVAEGAANVTDYCAPKTFR